MLLAALLALAPATPPLATIAEVRARPPSFAGKRVMLRGWVRRCSPLDCAISATAKGGALLGFESNARNDAILAPLVPTWVEIEGRVDPQCLGDAICTDRAPDLRDVSIRSIINDATPED